MQCASSTANSAIFTAGDACGTARWRVARERRKGAEPAGAQIGVDAAALCGVEAGVEPGGGDAARWSESTWSFIRAISGETTRVSPSAGGRELVAEALAAAGGEDRRGGSALQ